MRVWKRQLQRNGERQGGERTQANTCPMEGREQPGVLIFQSSPSTLLEAGSRHSWGSLHRHTGVTDRIWTPVFMLTQQALFTLWAISSALCLLFETLVVQLCKQSNVIRPHYPALFLAYISSSMFNTYFPFPYYIKENCGHCFPSVNIVECTFRSCVSCCKIQPCRD